MYKKILNYFFTRQLLPGCRVLWMKKHRKKNYLTHIKAPDFISYKTFYVKIVDKKVLYFFTLAQNMQICQLPFIINIWVNARQKGSKFRKSSKFQKISNFFWPFWKFRTSNVFPFSYLIQSGTENIQIKYALILQLFCRNAILFYIQTFGGQHKVPPKIKKNRKNY